MDVSHDRNDELLSTIFPSTIFRMFCSCFLLITLSEPCRLVVTWERLVMSAPIYIAVLVSSLMVWWEETKVSILLRASTFCTGYLGFILLSFIYT